MSNLPRIAIGTVGESASNRVIVWALMDLLERRGIRLQSFFCQARLQSCDASAAISGQSQRHLDTWLMSRSMCQEVFSHGMHCSDLGLIEGTFTPSQKCLSTPGGNLDVLCDWLDIPRLLVVDGSSCNDCRLPDRPDQLDGVLIDRVHNRGELAQAITQIESIWGVPVLGTLPEMSPLRDAVSKLPSGVKPPQSLCEALGTAMIPSLNIDRLLSVATQRQFSSVHSQVFQPCHDRLPLQVAVAYDDAFPDYFPDAFELLETQGARIVDFSPLHDECLPAGTDFVYLGDGPVARNAQLLARNHCLVAELRRFAERGGRIYAEGGGLAYLCRWAVLENGDLIPMVGALPARAINRQSARSSEPVELTINGGGWFGRDQTALRGYRNHQWNIEPTGDLNSYVVENDCRWDLIGHNQVVASRLQLDFAAQPSLIEGFFQPSRVTTGVHS